MEILQLSENNLDNLIDLVLELWPDCIGDEEHKSFRQVLSSDNEICYLIKEEGIYIAFIHLALRTDYVEGATDFPVAYIEALYVKTDYQKLGIGKRLVSAGESWSRQKGCRQLASDTELTNLTAIDFHKSIGFDEVNRIVCFVKEL